MPTVIKTYAGDSSPNITFNVSREDGSVVDLSNATVRLIIRNPLTGKRTNDANNSCQVISATQVRYAWNINGTDLPVAGVYKADIVITYPDQQEETYGLTINAEARA